MKNMVKRIMAFLLIGSKGGRVIFGPCRGLILPASVARKNINMLLGRYELANTKHLASLTKNCSVSYDVGAHVGIVSLLLLKLTGEEGVVYSFEPSPQARASLEELIHLNNLEDAIKVNSHALSDKVGELDFHIGDSSYTGILANAKEAKKKSEVKVITVQAETIDNLVYRGGFPVPELIKIDVESAEVAVVRGARQVLAEYRPKLFIEMHGPSACSETLTELLDLDYEVYALGEPMTRVMEPEQLRKRFRKGAWTLHVMGVPKANS